MSECVSVCLFLGTGECASSPPLRCRSAFYRFPKGDDTPRAPVPLSPGCGPTSFPGHRSPPAVSLLYRQTPVVLVGHLVSEVPTGGRCGQSRAQLLCAMPTILSHL